MQQLSPMRGACLNQEAAERILPAAEKYNIGISCATPLEIGLLATGPIPGRDYGRRSFSQECLDHVAKIQRLCQEYEIPLVAAALQWCYPPSTGDNGDSGRANS